MSSVVAGGGKEHRRFREEEERTVIGIGSRIRTATWPALRGPRRLRCSFCGKPAAEVDRLVAGASAHICDMCITKCVAVLNEHGGFEPVGPN